MTLEEKNQKAKSIIEEIMPLCLFFDPEMAEDEDEDDIAKKLLEGQSVPIVPHWRLDYNTEDFLQFGNFEFDENTDFAEAFMDYCCEELLDLLSAIESLSQTVKEIQNAKDSNCFDNPPEDFDEDIKLNEAIKRDYTNVTLAFTEDVLATRKALKEQGLL